MGSEFSKYRRDVIAFSGLFCDETGDCKASPDALMSFMFQDLKELQFQIELLKKENALLTESNDFYRDRFNWCELVVVSHVQVGEDYSQWIPDNGAIARETKLKIEKLKSNAR